MYYSAAILTLCIPDSLPVLITLPSESRQRSTYMMVFGEVEEGKVVVKENALVHIKE